MLLTVMFITLGRIIFLGDFGVLAKGDAFDSLI